MIPKETRDSDEPVLRWILAGVAMGLVLLAVSAISGRFDDDISDLEKPIITLVLLMITAGILYFYALWSSRGAALKKGMFLVVLVFGLIFRLCMFSSTPILEDDHYRYLWDGGVLANGFNPYQYPPSHFTGKPSPSIPDPLRMLARAYGPRLEKINYPWLRTIYPPLTQFGFALAHLIRPWDLVAWRAVLLCFDIVTLGLLFVFLRALRLPMTGLLIYWWNPLLIKEIYNSAHMDVLLFPFILGAMLFYIKGRYLGVGCALGLAFGVKFWPCLLLPVLLRPLFLEPKRCLAPLLCFSALAAASFLPFYLTGLGPDSGFTAYGRTWEMNDALFMVILWFVRFFTDLMHFSSASPQMISRAVVAAFLLCISFWPAKGREQDSGAMSARALLVVASLFLLSPTQFPWYYLWILPLLAIRPQYSLLFLTVTLPLYYMRFFLDARGLTALHDNGVVWLEFLPVWVLFFRVGLKKGVGLLSGKHPFSQTWPS